MSGWVVSKCRGELVGCKHITPSGTQCEVYPYPEMKWRTGRCPMCTINVERVSEQKHVDPIKASKRKMGVKK